MRSVGGRLLRALAWGGLVLVLGVALAAVALVASLGSEEGTRALVRLGVSFANRLMKGRLAVGAVRGTLFETLELDQASLWDAEGMEAIYAERLRLTLDVGALRQRRLHVREIAVVGARLTMRHLADNRFNLAALTPPSPPRPRPARPAPEPQRPLEIAVDKIHLELFGAYHPPRGHEAHTLEWPRGRFTIDGDARFFGRAMTFHIHRLSSDSITPFAAHVELRGGLEVTPRPPELGPTELTFSDIDLTLDTSGEELGHLTPPTLRPRGRWGLHVTGAGPLADLKAHLAVRPPVGSLEVEGAFARLASGPRWRGEVALRGIDPARLFVDALPGCVELDARGEGERDRGRASLTRFEGTSGAARLSAHGQIAFDAAGLDHSELVASAAQLDLPLGKGAAAPRLRITQADLTCTGERTGLGATARLRLDDGTTARLRLFAPEYGRSWRLRIDEAGLVHAGRPLALRTPLWLAATSAGGATELTLERPGVHFELTTRSPNGQLQGRGRFTLADVEDLVRPAPLHGRLAGDFEGQLGAQPHGTVHVSGQKLAAEAMALARIGLELRVDPEALHAEIDGSDAQLGSTRVSHFGATAMSDKEVIRIDAAGQVAGGPAAKLLASGRWRPDLPSELILQTLNLSLADKSARLVAPTKIHLHEGTARFDRFALESPLGRLHVDGRVGRSTDLTLRLKHGRLEQVGAAFGQPDLLPAALFDGRVHLAGTLAAPLLEVELGAVAQGTISWHGLAFNSLALSAFADSERVKLHTEAHGRGDTRAVLDLKGRPKRERGAFVGLSSSLEELALEVHGHRWQLESPCRIELGQRLDVAPCTLASGKANIVLAGALPLSATAADQQIDLRLDTHRLDLRDLSRLLAPGHREPPKTSFDIGARVRGTRAQPIVDLSLKGKGSEIDEGGLPENVDYRVSAHYEGFRVRGQASARQSGMRLGLGATFDLPIKLDGSAQPISLALEARPVPFFKIRDALPPKFADVRGFFSLRANASGTTTAPNLTVEAHAPSWALDNLRDNNTVVNLAYRDRLLVINSSTSFAAQGLVASLLRLRPQRDSGTIATELKLPIDLAAILRAPAAWSAALLRDAPLLASAEVRSVEVAKFPFQLLGLAAPATSGVVDAAVRLQGTLRRPALHAELSGEGLAAPGRFDGLAFEEALEWRDERLQLTGSAKLRGVSVLRMSGHTTIPAAALTANEDWQHAPLVFDAEMPALSLAPLAGLQPRLARLDGALRGQLHVRGTAAAPEAELRLDGDKLRVGDGQLETLHCEGALRDRRWKLLATADGPGGGKLRATGQVAEELAAPLGVSIAADRLDLGFAAAFSEYIGELGGAVDARLTVAGSRQRPRLDGWLAVDKGRLRLREDLRRYDGSLRVRFGDETATLERLFVQSGEGKLSASGQARLAGLAPLAVTAHATASRFEVGYGSAAARLDAGLELVVAKSDELRGQLRITRGTVWLPDLSGFPFGATALHLDDVRFRDRRALPVATRPQLHLTTTIDGPLELRSREATLDLGGALEVAFLPDRVALFGELAIDRSRVPGVVELLGHRYRIDAWRTKFSGEPLDPELALRFSRRMSDVMLTIDVAGSAHAPEVHLHCDPPIYDEAQLVTLVVAGGQKSDRFALHDIDRAVTGILSELVLRRVRASLVPTLPVSLDRPLAQESYAKLSQSPLEVGRFVSDRIYLHYERRLGSRIGRSPENRTEAGAEYRLIKGLELETTFGDAGVAGVYFMWTTKH